MAIELKVPGFPESVADGTILKWNKKPGEAVRREEPVVEIETDKVVFEVPAPSDGVLEDILEPEGTVVVSGQLIGHLREGETVVAHSEPEQVSAAAGAAGREPFATPSARRLIEEHGLDLDNIPASGSGNRVLKEDVLRVIEQPRQAPVVEQPQPTRPTAAPVELAPQTPAANLEGRPERRVTMTRLRARIAERLVEAGALVVGSLVGGLAWALVERDRANTAALQEAGRGKTWRRGTTRWVA